MTFFLLRVSSAMFTQQLRGIQEVMGNSFSFIQTIENLLNLACYFLVTKNYLISRINVLYWQNITTRPCYICFY